ncbi:MAG: Hemolysin III-like protein [Candidatus Uhrbacteria bacterium GW2011_GWE2_40_58]|nr:MAG: Hemolysin III-like protein [Candidatus Uhrbacteria bacterium GW2011_GWF2_40_263]KKR67477.1 MAG: Hemolysin III-like protein [Candidatus Uhrbacteria bacterium GW2011_GWE2_40_58]OGL94222.1 MAG: hypothetical protein A2239_03780 [Candidatus Uhrbacteria bacterium RIFOXYA2_FULL_40_9]OGL98071.1 MAG: hypothetical protein A2332_01685 [Candidatus Uhrbacteria bacterium RIFOXYB2_FULL_41_18]HBK35197.1 hemolysin III [Candidatus Uhrbacteria bacterium]
MNIERSNEPLSSLTHGLGFFLSVAALVLLTVFASLHGTAWHIVSYALFGTSLIFLYFASTLFHASSHPRKKAILQRIDHAMIYVLIAGTYTPICLVVLRGGWGWSLFGVIWGCALLGIIMKFLNVLQHLLFSTLLYLVMGWLVLVAIIPLLHHMEWFAFLWLLMGGIFYSVGAMFYLFDRSKIKRLFGFHEVFHLFVMAGSFCHFWLLLFYILPSV